MKAHMITQVRTHDGETRIYASVSIMAPMRKRPKRLAKKLDLRGGAKRSDSSGPRWRIQAPTE